MSARAERRAAERAARKQAQKTTALSTQTSIDKPSAPFPALTEISPARLAANQDNAQLSTGSVSMAGKAISSQNNTKHGLARHNGGFRILPDEDPAEFATLLKALQDEHQPQTETESILVSTMAESHWLANRAQFLQACVCEIETGFIDNAKLFALYLRYETTHRRAFHKALNDLLKLRAEKRKAELGFEAQKRQEEALRIKTEQHEMKKQAHYWEVLKKDGQACHQIAQNTIQNLNAIAQVPGFEAQYAANLAEHNLKRGPLHTAIAA